MKEFKKMLKEAGFTGKQFSEKLGLSYGYYRKATQNKRKMPIWVRAFIIGRESKNDQIKK